MTHDDDECFIIERHKHSNIDFVKRCQYRRRLSQEYLLMQPICRGPKYRGEEIETPKASRKKGNVEGMSPSPTDYRVWGAS